MSKDILDYQALVQEALRGVVRAALRRVEKDGRLPGAHHFYIAFQTGHPGVKVSEAILQRYPQEMTIVMQHQFWDLHVGEDDFQITLSFNNVPEKLSVPFAAVKNFFDPSTRFGLQFTVAGMEAAPGRVLETPGKERPAGPAAEPAPEPETQPRQPGEVVSLDHFRKK
ncbi:MAG: ClpXP protease specificity-enhancing factor SspB [Alphaproteobacteria bacterium]